MDSFWRAALYVLAVVDHDRSCAHVNGRSISREEVLAAAKELTDSKRILIALAVSLFNSDHTASLNEAVRLLDEVDFETAIHAMKIFKEDTDW